MTSVEASCKLYKSRTKKVEAASRILFGAVAVVPAPGHTRGHHSLRFDCGGQSVAIAGEAMATLDFWRERRSFYNAVDLELGAKTMDQPASIATIIVPGHDNYFLSK